jgi:hypothetical protein
MKRYDLVKYVYGNASKRHTAFCLTPVCELKVISLGGKEFTAATQGVARCYASPLSDTGRSAAVGSPEPSRDREPGLAAARCHQHLAALRRPANRMPKR